MKKRNKLLIGLSFIAILIALLVYYLSKQNIAVLNPAGTIATKERNLIVAAALLSAIVVIPVFGLTIMIAFKYREGNEKAKYTPDWDHSNLFESIWWLIPMVIVGVLSVITWNSSHALDPYRPIDSKTPSINIEVVSLDWKWLFIYPNGDVASVNQLELPVNTPVNFYLTSDTVMNSFWIPNLGGQIYAMPGMTTQLHLMATKLGRYYGSSSNISGAGFAGMNFYAVATSKADFSTWLTNAARSKEQLNGPAYSKLAMPSEYNAVQYYSHVDNGLFGNILMHYMPANSTSSTSMEGMSS